LIDKSRHYKQLQDAAELARKMQYKAAGVIMEDRIAITISSGRISPVFDVARTACVFVGKDDNPVATIELPSSLAQRADVLAKHGITRLVCGAISRQAHILVENTGIRVIGFVAGEASEILAAARSNRLPDRHYAMPGCRNCCRRRHERRGCGQP